MATRSLNRPASTSAKPTIAEGISRLLIQTILSLFLLPLNTSIVLSTVFLNHIHTLGRSEKFHRQLLTQNPHFYPRTILITGISTARGLKLARQFHSGGHRVIGADVGWQPVRPGGSMSNTIFAYYCLSKAQYVCNLVDIINKEKVDLWIPFSNRATPFEDGLAKDTIESRTACKCFHVNMNYVTLFSQNDSFLQHVSEQGLPVAEKQNVQSRDSLHRILNRSPNKAYTIYKASTGPQLEAVTLPKSTRSQTYSVISALPISKESPWVLNQRARVGTYSADLVLVKGHVRAAKIRPEVSQFAGRSDSRVESGLYETMKRLIESFAEKSGPSMSGHLSVQLMIDEEIASNSVLYAIYVRGCQQGSTAVSELLDDPPLDLYNCYLDVLSPKVNGVLKTAETEPSDKSRGSPIWLDYSALTQLRASYLLPAKMAQRLLKQIERFQHTINHLILLPRRVTDLWLPGYIDFSILDPLPWWWNYHISEPMKSLVSIFDGEIEAPVQSHL